MSAAVVPGAKLLASTTKGPALPFMLRPLPFCLRWAGKTLACGESSAFASREEEARPERAFCCGFVEEGLEGGLNGLFLDEFVLVREEERCSWCGS